MKRRLAHLPLHGGQAPAWLFRRMSKLAGAISMAIVERYGAEEMLRRLADPWWFQAFGSVLGFDWHSSGVTTVTCGALKDAFKRMGPEMGIIVAGGKGGTSRKTPQELAQAGDRFGLPDPDRLIYASRMSAKVDSAALQDGFTLYHHSFFCTLSSAWCVVQQGMSDAAQSARRYHWHGEHVNDFVCEPHAAIQSLAEQHPAQPTRPGRRQLMLLNMTAAEADANRRGSTDLVLENPDWLMGEVRRLTEGPTLFAPRHHRVLDLDINRDRLRRIVVTAHESAPADFETLLGLPGVGAATIRSLALLAEIIFQAPRSDRDPEQVLASGDPNARKWADYSFAHGGKDRTPFPVDTETYDRNIDVLSTAIREAKVGHNDRFHALERLAYLLDPEIPTSDPSALSPHQDQ